MKICHFCCPRSLNLITENFLCPTKFVFPLLTPCQHCCRIRLAVLSVELQPSWFLFLHSAEAQMQAGSSLQAVDVACHQLQLRSERHFHCRMAPPFQRSPWSLSVCYPGLDNQAAGIWVVTSGALGVVLLFTFILMVRSPLCTASSSPVQGKDHHYTLCWYSTIDHAPLDIDANAINCNSISNIQTISQKQSHPAEPKLTPKRLMEKKDHQAFEKYLILTHFLSKYRYICL